MVRSELNGTKDSFRALHESIDFYGKGSDMAHRNRVMKSDENLNWNSYHSSPTEIRMHIDYLRTKSIKQLIQLMDICYDDVKKYESEEWFYKWNPDDDWGVEFRYK